VPFGGRKASSCAPASRGSRGSSHPSRPPTRRPDPFLARGRVDGAVQRMVSPLSMTISMM
jgi:hypothetical protein